MGLSERWQIVASGHRPHLSECCNAALVLGDGDFQRHQWQCLACGRVYTGEWIAGQRAVLIEVTSRGRSATTAEAPDR